jgi:hypothetical protein
MADVKISGLPASTTPLAGTEVLPVVQSGATKQVSVANLTAGRATSALSYAATKDITASANQGSYSYGTLGYSDINIYSSYTSSANAYTQKIVQNTNAGAAASVDFVVSNDIGTASTYYGDFGVTSSGYNTPGQNIINSASTVYLQSVTMPLAIGTLNSNALSFYTNSTLVGAFSAAGAFSLTTALGVASGGTGLATVTAGQVLYGNGTSALSSSANMTFNGTTLTLANDATISTLTIGKGNSAITTNTALGKGALFFNTTGTLNTASGFECMVYNTTGTALTGYGYRALFNNTTGNGNYAFGSSVLTNNTTGNGNLGVGGGVPSTINSALLANTTGSNNTGIGVGSLSSNTTGGSNTGLGYAAGSQITTGSNNTIIGSNAQASSATAANEITIGNTSQKVIRYPLSYSTVANLPSAATVGQAARTFVTDALAPTFGASVAGGGAVFIPVYSDGTNWKVG